MAHKPPVTKLQTHTPASDHSIIGTIRRIAHVRFPSRARARDAFRSPYRIDVAISDIIDHDATGLACWQRLFHPVLRCKCDDPCSSLEIIVPRAVHSSSLPMPGERPQCSSVMHDLTSVAGRRSIGIVLQSFWFCDRLEL